jgi:hypothetical protein
MRTGAAMMVAMLAVDAQSLEGAFQQPQDRSHRPQPGGEKCSSRFYAGYS